MESDTETPPPVGTLDVDRIEPSPSRPSAAKSHLRLFYWIVALLFAGTLLFFSLRGIQWSSVVKILAHANPALIFASLAISTFSVFVRSLRWRVLLRAEAPIDVPTVFWATTAGYFGNSFLPARAGEVIRSLMVSRRTGLSKSFVLTTALSERMCDAIALVLISSVVLLSLPVKPGWFAHAAVPFAILGLAGAFGIAFLPALHATLEDLLKSIPFSAAIKMKIVAILHQVLAGMRVFHDKKRVLIFASLTLFVWFSDSVSITLGMRALGIPGTLTIAILLATGLGLGSALPSTPGYVGIYQFVAVSVLTPFGFSKTAAIAYILLSQALQYFLAAFWGGFGIIEYRRR